MLTVAQALNAILHEVQRGPKVRVPLADAQGLVLAESVPTLTDLPPFAKALMDGYAVRSADLGSESVFAVVDEIMAGDVPRRPIEAGQAARIMTGAMLSPGADVVVPVEETRETDAGASVRIGPLTLLPGRNVLWQGAVARQGDVILRAGCTLRAPELGCLAELGCASPLVHRRPRVAVLATGNELVPVSATPGPGQIRNSNETMLVAQLRQQGAEAIPLGVARDERRELCEKIEAGLQCDLLLLSGGVSAGQLDLVPDALREMHVREVFHKVRIKPGHPLWFGVLDRESSPSGTSPTYVFGLPGNPVSSMVCCELFVGTAIRRWMGVEPALPVPVRARLSQAIEGRYSRPTYHPARLEYGSDGPAVHTVRWVGSADLAATATANALVYIPEGEQRLSTQDVLDVFPW